MTVLTVLSPDEVEALHHSSLRILAETGIFLSHPEGRLLLDGAGCRVLEDRVLIPPQVMERALSIPRRPATLRGRNGSVKVLGDGSLYWHNLGGARDVYDPVSQKRRPAVLQDVCDSTRLLDALPAADTITPFFTPQDVPGELMALAMYRHALPHTTKPLQGPGVQTAAEVDLAVKMASVLGPPSQYLTLGISPVSPLIFPDDVVASMLATARHGVPLAPLPCPTAGATSPLTIPGAVAQQNAEVLASLLLAQLANPGLPVIYCGRLAMMEPRSGYSVWGGVELGLASAVTVQIAHRYGLPVNVYGFSTNSHNLDLQNGFERSLNAVIPALVGADELSGIGEMEAGVMSCYAQMVIDDEIASSVRRLRRGSVADNDTLAVEVVASAMAGTRNFLGERHTRQHLRRGEIQLTKLAERRPWEQWERDERRGMAERAQAEAERILAEHEVPPLEEAQERELDALLNSFYQSVA
jgi:trimethylamine--corrinoid protein Co-methyltransferase